MHVASAFPPVAGSGIRGDARRLQLRGQPRLWGSADWALPRTAFPFHPLPPRKASAGPSRGSSEAVRGRSCQQDGALACAVHACLWHGGHGARVSDPPGL